MKFLSINHLYIIIRIALGITFIWASVDKIINPGQFAEMINNYKMVPPILIPSMASFLPWIELFTGTALIIGFWERGALVIFNVLIAIFMIALTSALIRGLDIQCGCFTVSPDADKEIMISLIRDVFMILAGMWGLTKAIQNHPTYSGCHS
ncbi:Methylamine utilization protein mauE [Candidatus Magnetomorum sp. HK-1]|nr:Methylamine utilization protein mauE [Candidatus Magnetomorum sp. HK-1]